MIQTQWFTRVTDTRGQTVVCTWPELLQAVQAALQTEAQDKTSLPAIGPYVLEPGAPAKNEHVQAITVLMYDLDEHTQDELTAILGKLQASGLAAFVYETPSGLPRCRVGIQVDRPLAPAEYPSIRVHVAASLGMRPDKVAKDLRRYSFVGRLHGTTPRAWHAFDGRPLPVDQTLAAAPHVPARDPVPSPSAPSGQLGSKLVDRAELLKTAKRLQKLDSQDLRDTGAALERCLRGDAFASSNRNNTAFKMAGEIMKAEPYADPEHVVRLLRAGLEATGEPTPEAFLGQLERQASIKIAEHEAEQERQATLLKLQASLQQTLALRPAPGAPRPEPAPVTITPSAGAPTGPLVVQKQGSYWLRPANSPMYRRAVCREDAVRAIQNEYAAYLNDPPNDLVPLLREVSSTVAESIEIHPWQTGNTLDPVSNTMRVGHVPPAGRAVRHADVEAWLQALLGEDFEAVLGWIASCKQSNMRSPAAVLCLIGDHSLGKSLLVRAISYAWHGNTPTPGEVLTHQFNADLEDCPIVFFDETFGELTGDRLRELSQLTTFRTMMKGKERRSVHCALRIAVSLNSPEQVFTLKGVNSIADKLAIAQRMSLVVVPENRSADVREALRELRERCIAEGAVGGYPETSAIAEYVRWAFENVIPKPARFLGTAAHTAEKAAGLLSAASAENETCEALADYLSEPKTWEIQYKQNLRMRDLARDQNIGKPVLDCIPVWVESPGRVLVSLPTLAKYLGKKDNEVKRDLQLLLKAGGSAVVRYGYPRRWHELDLSAVRETLGVDPETLQATVSTTTKDRLQPKAMGAVIEMRKP